MSKAKVQADVDEGCCCDWGRCCKPAIAVRLSPTHGWLPVCVECKEKP